MYKVSSINIVWLLSAGGYRHWQQQIFIHLLQQQDTCTKNLHLINYSGKTPPLPKSGRDGLCLSCAGDICEDMLARIHNDSSSGTCISRDLWRKNILKINRYDMLCHIQWGLKGGWQTATDGHVSGMWHSVSQDLKAAAKTKSRGKKKDVVRLHHGFIVCSQELLSLRQQEGEHIQNIFGNFLGFQSKTWYRTFSYQDIKNLNLTSSTRTGSWMVTSVSWASKSDPLTQISQKLFLEFAGAPIQVCHDHWHECGFSHNFFLAL